MFHQKEGEPNETFKGEFQIRFIKIDGEQTAVIKTVQKKYVAISDYDCKLIKGAFGIVRKYWGERSVLHVFLMHHIHPTMMK